MFSTKQPCVTLGNSSRNEAVGSLGAIEAEATCFSDARVQSPHGAVFHLPKAIRAHQRQIEPAARESVGQTGHPENRGRLSPRREEGLVEEPPAAREIDGNTRKPRGESRGVGADEKVAT